MKCSLCLRAASFTVFTTFFERFSTSIKLLDGYENNLKKNRKMIFLIKITCISINYQMSTNI